MAARLRLHELVAANAPVLYLHPDERFMPCSAEFFLEHSELRKVHPDGTHGVLLDHGEVTGATLAAAQRRNKGGDGLMLALYHGAKFGAREDQLDEVPVYVNVKEVMTSDGTAEALELNYIICFAHNGPYTIMGCFQAGAHDGDWEHFTVRIDASTGATLGAFFHAHRNQDGVWASAAAMPRCPDGCGRPAAFVALNGHGTYPQGRLQLRAGMFANDRTKKGLVWRPKRCFLLPYAAGTYKPAQPAPQPTAGRRLMQVLSRGTTLPPVAVAASSAAVAPAAFPAAGAAAADSGSPTGAPAAAGPSAAKPPAAAAPGASAEPGAVAAASPAAVAAAGTHPAAAAGAHPAVEVAEDPAAWLAFTGRWGSMAAPSPISQKWFTNAEPPVSRTLLRRILHFPAEQQLGEKGC